MDLEPTGTGTGLRDAGLICTLSPLQTERQSSPAGGGGMRRISSQTRMKILSGAHPAATVTGAESHLSSYDSMRRVNSSSSLSSLSKSWNANALLAIRYV